LESSRTDYEGTGRRYFSECDPVTGHPIAINISDIDAPKEASAGGHGTSEYYLVRDFLNSIKNDTVPPIDIVRAMDMTVPGLIAHEAAMKGSVWMDVPRLTD